MFKHEQLIHCQQRKAALLRQCSEHRRILAVQAQPLCAAANWMDRGIMVARQARASWLLLAPLLFLRKIKRLESAGFLHNLAKGISLARLTIAIWKRW